MPQIDRAWLLDVLRSLVSINSVNPSLVPGAPGEGEIARYLADECRKAGLEVVLAEVVPGRPDVIATLRGRGGGRTLLLNGHMDTVSVTGMADPFEPIEREGRIYGRGAYDMKGGVAAMVAAAIAVRRTGVALAGDVVVTMVVDEEYASIGTEAIVRQVRADAAIVTEPTALSVGVAHKGFAWVTFETFGRAAHGSRYDEGHDAIVAMGRVLDELDQVEHQVLPFKTHPLLGRPSVHASLISGGDGLSTYPAHCRLQVERRTLPQETVEEVAAEMREVLQRASRGDVWRARADVTLFRPGYEISPEDPIVQTLVAACERVFGRRPAFSGQWPWLDSAILGGAGIPTVIFGPAGAGAHSNEEYVETESVVRCAEVLAETMITFCGSKVDDR